MANFHVPSGQVVQRAGQRGWAVAGRPNLAKTQGAGYASADNFP
jgi:hypothetical protein